MKVLNIGSLNIDRVYEVEHFVKPGETIFNTFMLLLHCVFVQEILSEIFFFTKI